MLAYYVEWHMRQAPVLFDDHQRDEAAAFRTPIVAPAQRSTAVRRKAANKVAEDGLPVLSFQSLLAELATFTATPWPSRADHKITSCSIRNRHPCRAAPSKFLVPRLECRQ
jgi:hypothetical protein